jgi:hypothetical protein
MELLRELLTSDNESTQIARSDEAAQGYRGVTNQPLTPNPLTPASARSRDSLRDGKHRGATNQALTANPLAPASARSKDALIGGKPVRFAGPREFTAVVLIIGVTMVVYLCFWGLYDVTKEVEKQSNRFNNARKKVFERGLGSASKKSPQSRPKISIPPLTPTPTRIVAPDTQQIREMVVGVVNGELGNLDGRTVGEYLYLTLQITNLGTKPTTYPSWARPDLRVTLRDQNGHSFERIPSGTQDGIRINPGCTITDILVFEQAPAFVAMDLNLPIPGRGESFQFRIPAGFIRRTPPPESTP